MAWWLSFCDPTRPKGSRFLGVAMVGALDFEDGVEEAWRFGCNPGGEIQAEWITPQEWAVVPDALKRRLLTEEELSEHQLTSEFG
jgi:hypothetical protein